MELFKKVSLSFFLSLICFAASAQFYTIGDNPASTRWYSITSQHYQLIFPSGLDSLATLYAQSLEKYYSTVGNSVLHAPSDRFIGRKNGKIPVILHPFNASSNGSVAWAPKRVDLYTSPSAYSPEPLPWLDMLTLHEQRHVAQMQTGLSNAFRPFGYIVGEMFNGLVAGVYIGSFYHEGDAVVAETALSRSGRGRSADFQNYYMIAFDQGDRRNLMRWRLTQQKYYTPNHYAAGYLWISGIRYLYDCPNFLGEYFDLVSRRPWEANGVMKVVKRHSGIGSPKTIFTAIADTLSSIWGAEIAARAPYTPYSEIVSAPRRYTQYSGNSSGVHSDITQNVYSVRTGISKPAALVKVYPDGHEKVLRAFPAAASDLAVDNELGRIYWTEYKYDRRWSLKTGSILRYYDLRRHRTKTVSHPSNLFSPSISASDLSVVVSKYNSNGRTGLIVLDKDGNECLNYDAPDSLQVIEAAIFEDCIVYSALSSSGYGLYSLSEQIIAPEPVTISNLCFKNGLLWFESDRSGVNELYTVDLASREVVQKTSSKYGGAGFTFASNRLYYSLKGLSGDLIVSTPVDSLFSYSVNFADIHRYPIADRLSEQEATLAQPQGSAITSPAVRYRRFPHLFKPHSWAPFYFNVDNIMNMSYDVYYDLVSLGATGLFQNELGNAITQIGYSAHKDPYSTSSWRHSGHLKFTYTGLYPVIEATLDFNDRAARQYQFITSGSSIALSSNKANSIPYLSGQLSVYVPLTFTRGGWSAGLIPQVTWKVTNDTFTLSALSFSSSPFENGFQLDRTTHISQALYASIRGYSMRPTADSGVYPRWGIGAQLGLSIKPSLTDIYSPLAYYYVYGYAPGVLDTHGIPIDIGSPSVSGFLYIKRIVLTPHFDYTSFSWSTLGYKSYGLSGDMYSLGASLTANFRALFWIKAPIEVGVTASLNGGDALSGLSKLGLSPSPYYVGPVFSVTFN